MLDQVHPVADDRVIVGLSALDDAGVIKTPSGDWLVQTVDFFTPIVDDPFLFGQAAAANSLSDVYAMGGIPLNALTIACFPDTKLPLEILAQIVGGAQSKLIEAGCALLGGHTVRDREVKFGFSVTGIVKPDELMTKANALAGDLLVLTKGIGTGILATAEKRGTIAPAGHDAFAASISRLNAAAAKAAAKFQVKCATDVTGFGLIGHAFDLAKASGLALRIFAKSVPLLATVDELALDPKNFAGGLHRNRIFVDSKLTMEQKDDTLLSILFDPQTSGGLLLAIAPDRCDALCRELREQGDLAEVVGEFATGESTVTLLNR